MRDYYSRRSTSQRPAQEQLYIPLFDQQAVREKMLRHCLCQLPKMLYLFGAVSWYEASL